MIRGGEAPETGEGLANADASGGRGGFCSHLTHILAKQAIVRAALHRHLGAAPEAAAP